MLTNFWDDLRILPKNNTDISRYSDAILIHTPKNTLNLFFEKHFSTAKKTILTGNRVRRPNSSDNADARMDKNLTDRIAKLTNVIGNNLNVYTNF